MANGIMAGSGTKTDPYLIEDIYDFLSIPGGSTVIYYKLVNDIDFNDHETYKYGISEVLVSNAYIYIDGDGHEIRNMILNGTDTKIVAKEISNISFSNIILNAIKGGKAQIAATTFNNCQFGYFSSNSSLGCIFKLSATGTFNDCTFNISGSTYNNIMWCTFNRTHIHFNNFLIKSSSIAAIFMHDTNASSAKVIFNNTYMTGKINALCSKLQAIFYGYGNMAFSNSYFACDLTTDNTLVTTISSATMNSTCFMDNTLAHNKIRTDSTDGWYVLTTEQCKDNDYLQSIGFQAFPDESV